MKLSIILISYNHEKYIAQALQSILSQNIDNISAELVITDDCSNDNTPKIIEEILSNNNSNLSYKILKNDNNLGFVRNYQKAFGACVGEYIAIMEGDDYWTDNDRLVKLVNLLDHHPEFSLIMNRFGVYNEATKHYHTPEWEDGEGDLKIVSTPQMAEFNRLGNLSACVLRKKFLDNLNPDIFDMYIADWMIGLAISEYGPICITKEILSVYRTHEKSEWSKMNLYDQVIKTLPLVDMYNNYLGLRYNAEFCTLKKRMLDYKKNFEKENSPFNLKNLAKIITSKFQKASKV